MSRRKYKKSKEDIKRIMKKHYNKLRIIRKDMEERGEFLILPGDNNTK